MNSKLLIYTLYAWGCFALVAQSAAQEIAGPIQIEHNGTLYVHPENTRENVVWYNGEYILMGADDAMDGSSNTQKIVETYGNTFYGARFCDTLEAFGYNDWYLPAKDELLAIYENREKIPSFVCMESPDELTFYAKHETAVFYWSSTEVSEQAAWALNSCDGLIRPYAKRLRRYFVVRCVRRD